MVVKTENVRKMQQELRPILKGYRKRYISKQNITFYLLEQPSPWVASMSPNYRGRLITTAMLKIGWKPFSGNKNKKIRSFVRK